MNRPPCKTARKIRRRPEQEQQIALFRWAALAMASEPARYGGLAYMTHVPNGGKRNAREAGILKAMGVKPGVPDVLWPQAGVLSPIGLAFEMKAMKGRVIESQEKWLHHLTAQGWATLVVQDWTVARDLIRMHLGVKA